MTDSGHILLVDDEPAFQRLGAAFLRAAGYRVSVAGDAQSAVLAARDNAPDVVLLDLAMPPHMSPEGGLDLIGQFAPSLVIVLTGHADHALALRATELGAWDFLAKPADPDMLGFVVSRAVRKARLDAELRERRARDSADDLGMIGHSAAMQGLREMVRRLGPTNISVVILGPTGSGKELVARALHTSSPRRAGPFVPVHCGALPAELLESELFGHVKGSFTGAYRDQPGLVETANRGTLFLDEVGEMPAPMQVKLLRFLQEGTFVPVGGRVQKRADVRLLAATHRDLQAMVAEQVFREDLFYRLRGMVLRTPALSDRMDDIPILATNFLRRSAPKARLTPDAIAYLRARAWPGNVRELRAILESAAALAQPDAPIIDADSLRFTAGEDASSREPTAASHGTLDEAVAELETRLLRETLEATAGNQSEAARRLGLSRVGLAKKLHRLGLRS
jgi:two-component system NtrC family response regulator